MMEATERSPKKSWLFIFFSSSDALVQFTLTISVFLSLSMVGLKLYAYMESGSLALFSTLLDSILDAGISGANFFAVRRASRPPSQHYRFGHGKVESLAVLGQSAFIAATALFLLFNSLERFHQPEALEDVSLGVGVMIISLILTVGLLAFQRYVIHLTRSHIISVDYLHYVMDFFLGCAVVLSLVLGKWFHMELLDPVFALIISIYILVCAWRLFKKAIEILMDREFHEDKREIIKNLIMSHKGVLGYHELRTRSSGKKDFIQFHIELPDHLPLIEAHSITDEVEKAIQEQFPQAEIIIHQDPVSLVEKHKCLKSSSKFTKKI